MRDGCARLFWPEANIAEPAGERQVLWTLSVGRTRLDKREISAV
jgi:hypothetical protein